MSLNIIRLHHFETSEGSMIAISFPMTEPCKAVVKQLSGRRWCPVNKWIYVRNTAGNLREIFIRFRGVAWIDAREYFKPGTDCKTEVGIVNSIPKRRTYIHFPYGAKPEWIDRIRKIEGSFHVSLTGDWSLPGSNENYLAIREYFTDQGCSVQTTNIGAVKKQHRNQRYGLQTAPLDNPCLQEYRDMLLLKRVSNNTSKNYISMFSRFLVHFNNKDINSLTKVDIRNFLLREIQNNGISMSVQNQMINAIKYYYEKVLGRPREIYELPRPKFGKTEPIVLNMDELQKILTGIKNLKHRCIISLIFSAGLRRHELINLKVHDIDMERRVINIHKGKGNKDRISVLGCYTADVISEYIKEYKPVHWLFEGQGGEQYSAESIWKIFDRIKKRFHIEKKGNVHLLRHTFATNLLEAGTDIRMIQKLLGHSSLRTTEIYTHIANNNLIKIKSPIDQLDLQNPKFHDI